MNKFELYTMIFYTLDYYWDQNGGEELGMFLSDMSPFTFEGVGSANPVVYEEFCEYIQNENIDVADSYVEASKYIEELKSDYIKEAFSWVTEESWLSKCNNYLRSNDNK